MTGRVALVLTTSTLHLRHGVAPFGVLERQLRLLAATGHHRVILLGGERNAGGVWAADGEAAAEALEGAEAVTVLGHATVATEAAVERIVRAGAIAARADGEGWERIDSTDGWAGVMRLPGGLVRATLRELGEWDAQATLLRRAVQADLPRLAVEEGATAHGFAPAECEALLAGERAGRLAVGPVALTERGQALADRLARWLDRRTVRAASVALLCVAVLCLAVLGSAVAGWVLVAAFLLPVSAFAGGVAASAARLDRRSPWPGPAGALAGVALAPPVLAIPGMSVVVGGGAPILAFWTAALLAATLLITSRRQAGHWLRLDTAAFAIAGGLAALGSAATVMWSAPILLLTTLLSPAARRRLTGHWRRWQD